MISDRRFDAVVWDMDGMLLDTERLSFLAWKHGAESLGRTIDESVFHGLIGLNSKAIQAQLSVNLGAEIDVVELTRIAGAHYDELISDGAPVKKGAAECLSLLAANGIPQALATSSSMRIASRKLTHHGLFELFSAVVTGDQVAKGKPDSEPYLLAAERLSVDPSRCIAFEDSVNGIRSAHAAGMRTVLVPDMAMHNEASRARVWKEFDSLEAALPFLRETFQLD